MAGFLFDILNVVHSTLGFNFTFISPTPSGLIDENVWTNLIEMVGRYEVDFSMMDTTIMLSRFKIVDFSTSIYSDDYRLFMRKPTGYLSLSTFTDVFSKQFWIMIILIMVGLTGFLYIAFTFKNVREEGASLSIADSMAIVFYSFIGQGISISPSKTSQRMLILSIYLTGGVLLWSYSAVLISFLTVEKFYYPIKSYRDLLDNPQYLLFLHTTSIPFLNDGDFTINKEQALLWQKTKNDPNSFSEDYGYLENMILKNPMAVFFGSKLFSELELKNCPCLIDKTSNALGKANNAWAFPKGSPYFKLINHQLTIMKETGLMKKLLEKQLSSKARIPCEDQTSFRAISYEKIVLAFLILPAGILIAFLILFVEIVKARIASSHPSGNNPCKEIYP